MGGMGIRLSFHGAAGTVTGSRHLLETSKRRVLFDCGLFQGERKLREMNWADPDFSVRTLDAVVLTHAHIDHTGYLPRLVKLGYRGPIYATPPTIDLAEILLLDSAGLQEEDAEYANKKGFSRHSPALPLYTTEDAERVLRQLRPLNYEEWHDFQSIRTRFHSAGHILGSAHVEVEVEDDGERATLEFSGDMGRYGVPLHADPKPMRPVETVILESTYGNRTHEKTALDEQLLRALTPTLRRGGTVLIPAFAVARTQLLVWLLAELINEGRLQRVPIHIDSPMAVKVSELYDRYARTGGLDEDVRRLRGALKPESIVYHRTREESMDLNSLEGPRIVVSSSGMLAGGRVLHHLKRLAPDARNLILLAGFQAYGTRGRDLVDGKRSVRVHGQDVPVRAEVANLAGFSAHADAGELERWLTSAKQLPESVFLVHGEVDAAAEMAARLRKAGVKTFEPRLGDGYVRVDGGWRRE